MAYPQNISGQRFGKLTAISMVGRIAIGNGAQTYPAWECICDCGNKKIAVTKRLRAGIIKSCGKCPIKDLKGKRFGRLTVLTVTESFEYYLCKCDCGNSGSYMRDCLIAGKTKSCGCLKRDFLESKVKHGMSNTKPYRTHKCMLDRCNNPKNVGYKNYGGRGIKVCERWQNSFENFYSDMGNPPTSKHSIDRIDNNGNYEPSNCRWATSKEQAANKRPRIKS